MKKTTLIIFIILFSVSVLADDTALIIRFLCPENGQSVINTFDVPFNYDNQATFFDKFFLKEVLERRFIDDKEEIERECNGLSASVISVEYALSKTFGHIKVLLIRLQKVNGEWPDGEGAQVLISTKTGLIVGYVD